MTIASGTRLGPYEILAPLGAGGMGEVYRARDARLGRDVAVKVLPRAMAGDPERQQRFEAEARAAGALNHPNIVTLHDVGLANGSPYLVTEVLEGESLRAMIERGPLEPAKAVGIVIQIANGLAAAHAKGIIHRDLKPENLFVLPDGRVKILDFGIAKLTKTEAAAHAETTPVFASLTATGTIMGTVSYMAPEQLRDQPVDHRADLFALGAILHELVSGSQPFPGETAADRVSAILVAEPPLLPSQAEQEIPGIGAVVRRLLAKRPESRFGSASDLAFTLELLTRRPAPVRGPEAGAAPIASSIPRFRTLTFRDGEILNARFAPDGQTVVYQAAFEGEPSEIFLSRVESPEARGLGLRGADLQAVSAAAEIALTLRVRDIGGFIRLGTLARVPLVGGRPRELVDDVFQADWSPDGKALAAIRRSGANYRLEAPLGTVVHTTTGWMSDLRYAPDGKQIAFLDHPYSGSNSGYVCVLRPGEAPRRLTEHMTSAWRLVWRPDGREIWFGGEREDKIGVLGVTLDGSLRHVYSAPGFAEVNDLARDGRALLVLVRPRMRMETSTRSAGAAGAANLSWMDWSLARDLSPDGSLVLFDETGFGTRGVPGAFVRSIHGEPAIRIADGICSALSEDGRYALVGEIAQPGTIAIVPTGAGETRRIPVPGLSINYADWIPGGRELLLVASAKGAARRLYRIDLESASVISLQECDLSGHAAMVSPDGTLALARSASAMLTVFPMDGGPPREFAELDSVYRPAGWAEDSRSFFVFRGDVVPAPVFRVDVATGAREPWTEIVPMARSGAKGINSARFSRDGERYVYSYMRIDSVLFHADGLT